MTLASGTQIKRIFLCPICRREYRGLASLKAHFNKNHVLIKCPVCGRNLSSKNSGGVHHFFRRKDKPHLAFLYLLMRGRKKRVLWKEACELAATYFSTSYPMLLSLISDKNKEGNPKLIDKKA